MTITPRMSRSSVLRSLDDPETTPRVEQLSGRPLLPVPFRPESGRPPEADGAPLSKFGWEFREALARLQKVEASDIPLGLIRLVEGLNADTDDNLAGLARPVARYTEFGMLWSVPFLANVPLLMAWLINGRALRGIASELGRDVSVVTTASDHDTLSLPTMRVEDPEQVLELLSAQQKLLRFDGYAGEERDLVDSIATNGVLDPLDVVLTQLVSDHGSAWTAQAAEGARRLFASQLGMTILSNRDVASLATKHWLGPQSAFRDLGPHDLVRIAEALTFSDSAAAAYFPGKDRRTWIERTASQQPPAVAWQLMRTVRVNLIVAIEPNSRASNRFDDPKSATVQELIRRYHVGGKAKRSWQQADVDGVAAITLLDTFRRQDRITSEERAVWLGQRDLAFDNPLDGVGDEANLLASVVRLIGCLTVRGTTCIDGKDGVDLVQAVLRDNGANRPQPSDRARVAAAQALVPLKQHNEKYQNQIAAALQSLFRDALLWKSEDHAGDRPWTDYLNLPLDELEAAARQDLAEHPNLNDPVMELRPARRALGALGMTALIVNPALLEDGNAVTRTGKGGGGRSGTNVSAADPSKLLLRMLLSTRGLDQLVDAITALIAGRAPAVPADRETRHTLDDLWLRQLWFGGHAGPSADPTPYGTYLHELTELVDVALMEQHSTAEWLKTVTESAIVGEEEDGEDGGPMYERFGVPEEIADRARALLRNLDDFFNDGKAIARFARRNGR
jgi:hypothetical protein